MLKILLSGCNGRMGQAISRLCSERDDIEITCGVDVNTANLSNYPVYKDPMEYFGPVDVVIDFSSPDAVDALLYYCNNRSLPLVLCATGYNDDQLTEISNASKHFPIFRSGNMSLGINLLIDLIQKAISVLGSDYDVEILERHHNKKLDAPSGTAIMLAEAVKKALPYDDAEYVYERSSVRQPRGKHEIGISSIRGGTIVGEHEVIFAGHDEVIELKHSIQSREVFASGAIKAAIYMAKRTEPGMYNMADVIAENS